jgi:two-component system chemotaxis response regulator CheY
MSAMRALVVDDSRVMRKIIVRSLTRLGFECLEAGDGEEAVGVVETEPGKNPVDLLVVDWNMPNMNGIELVEYMRSTERFDQLRIVMATSESEIGRLDEALLAGADEYLMKPFDEAALADKLVILGLLDECPVT